MPMKDPSHILYSRICIGISLSPQSCGIPNANHTSWDIICLYHWHSFLLKYPTKTSREIPSCWTHKGIPTSLTLVDTDQNLRITTLWNRPPSEQRPASNLPHLRWPPHTDHHFHFWCITAGYSPSPSATHDFASSFLYLIIPQNG